MNHEPLFPSPFFNPSRPVQLVEADIEDAGGVCVHPVHIEDAQPMAAEDVASAIADAALSEPANDTIEIAGPDTFTLIAGPCVIENEKLCRTVAASLIKTCKQLDIFYVFKASFDKANRTSGKAFRGPGVEAGLKTLAGIREEFGVPILTDVHTEAQAAAGPAVLRPFGYACALPKTATAGSVTAA